ncbi:MAG: hypothetical protein IIC02_09970, partial [Planctomycetes bacterium]|nr:hypothetical protein [Planctomycetota bacterium]
GTTLTIDSFTDSIYWPAGAIVEDGTNCATPALVTINSGPKQYTIVCTDNDSSTLYGNVGMPDSWDGGTFTYRVYWTTAAGGSSQTVAWDLQARAFADDDPLDAAQGTAIEVTDIWIANDDVHITSESSALTVAGSPAGATITDVPATISTNTVIVIAPRTTAAARRWKGPPVACDAFSICRAWSIISRFSLPDSGMVLPSAVRSQPEMDRHHQTKRE